VTNVVDGRPALGKPPPEVARQIHGHADRALALLASLSAEGHKELRLTLG